MSNLNEIVKVMETLPAEKQKKIVTFKEVSMLDRGRAAEVADQDFDKLSCVQKIRVLYAVSGEEVELEENEKVSLIEQLILIDTPLKGESIGDMLAEMGVKEKVEDYSYPSESGKFGSIVSSEDDFETEEPAPDKYEEPDEDDFEEADLEDTEETDID